MKKFKFNLSALLKMRKRYEERMVQEFSDQQRRVTEQECCLREMIKTREKTDDEVRKLKKEELDVPKIKANHDYLVRLHEKVQKAQTELTGLKEELEQRRQALVKAQQDVSILEKLKDKRLENYHKELTKEEQDFLDEVAITNHPRKSH